jgi:hypothetical protein
VPESGEVPGATNVTRAVVGAGLRYFVFAFGAGFLLALVRIPFLVPRLGERWAELIEMPFMLAVIVFAARHVMRRAPLRSIPQSLGTGAVALALLLTAEVLVGVVFGSATSLRDYVAHRDPVSGSVYLAMLLVFAAMPALVVWRWSRRG